VFASKTVPRTSVTGGEYKMAKRLFVGNLPYSVDDNQLATLFGEVGTVSSATVIIDRMSGRAKGFGFVEMSTDEESDKAVAELNGREMDGRKIIVNEARPMEERAPRDGGSFSRGPRRDFGGNRGGSNSGSGRRY
jgi:RNA recognition motif-containing protein